MPDHSLRVARKVGADLTTTYHGSRYLFPDAIAGEVVAFIDGKPESATARRLKFNEQVTGHDSKSRQK